MNQLKRRLERLEQHSGKLDEMVDIAGIKITATELSRILQSGEFEDSRDRIDTTDDSP